MEPPIEAVVTYILNNPLILVILAVFVVSAYLLARRLEQTEPGT